MSTDLRAIMHYRSRAHDMIRDPDLTGDLLLLALCMVDVLHERKAAGRKTTSKSWNDVRELAWGTDDSAAYKLKSTIRSDVPRYQPVGSNRLYDTACVAPMIRREGPCGKRSHVSFVDRDPETGEGQHIGYCTRHWSHELIMVRQRRDKAWVANGRPKPPANTGGVLARYFQTNWDSIYGWADQSYEPSEAGGGKPPTPPRPTFTLIQGAGGEESPRGSD